MKPIETQMTLADINDDYKAFVEKFKPKKTTDDCYTPENIYEVVKNWACREYGIDPERIVRPFWPGADYERYPYKEGDVVLDNPPFSIVAKIVKFYNSYEIPFFIFAPYLTNFTGGMSVSHIINGESIVYQNGAEVATSFLTNMDEWFIRSAPDLQQEIKKANAVNRRAGKNEIPKYVYPHHVLTATAVGYMSGHGVEFKVRKEDCYFIRGLDSQKKYGKSLCGGGASCFLNAPPLNAPPLLSGIYRRRNGRLSER